VGFYKRSSGKPSITWPEAVDGALCFGWIDGVRKSIDEVSYTIRFTPRRPRSIWSDVNIKRVRDLMKLELMQPAGLEAFRRREEAKSKVYSYEQRKTAKLGRAYEQKGLYKEAVEEFQKARQLDDKPFVLAALGQAFAASGRRGDAQMVLDELSQLSKRMYVDSYYVAAIHASLGETDKAFQSLEKAFDDRSTWLSRIKVDPLFDSLHSDPRFTSLVKRIGLP